MGAGGWWGCGGGGSGGGCRPRGGLGSGQVGPLGSLAVQDHVYDLLTQLAWLGTTEPAASLLQHGPGLRGSARGLEMVLEESGQAGFLVG